MDHVSWPCDRESGYGDATCHGFEHDDAECVGQAGEDEDIGSGIGLDQIVSPEDSRKIDFRIKFTQLDTGGAVADDHLLSGEVQLEEGRQILLHGDPAYVEKYGTVPPFFGSLKGAKLFGVDPARPSTKAVKAAVSHFFLQAGR